MHTRRLVKRSILGSRVYAPSPTGDGAPVTGVVQAVKQENRDVSAAGARRSVYTVLMQDGSLKEFSEEEIAAGFNHTAVRGPLKSSLKVSVCVCACVCVRVCVCLCVRVFMCAKRLGRQQRFTVFVVWCFAAFNRFLHGADLTASPPPLLLPLTAHLISWNNTIITKNSHNTCLDACCIK